MSKKVNITCIEDNAITNNKVAVTSLLTLDFYRIMRYYSDRYKFKIISK